MSTAEPLRNRKAGKGLEMTLSIIRNEWTSWGVTVEQISDAVLFYSGQAFPSFGADPYEMLRRDSLWMSQSAFWAAGYCYWDGASRPETRILLKVKFNKPTRLLRFPDHLHPAEVFKVHPGDRNRVTWRKDMPTPVMQPDHFVSMYWTDILKGTEFEGIVGHFRKAKQNDVDTLGAAPGDVIEAWVSDVSIIEVVEWREMPYSKHVYVERYCDDKSRVGELVFR